MIPIISSPKLSCLLLLLLFAATAHSTGMSGCPCLTSSPFGSGSIVYQDIEFPSSYGVGCKAHDVDPEVLGPFCKSPDPSYWCTSSFCYVDPNNCDVVAMKSYYFPDDDVYFSYETCGTKGTYKDEIIDNNQSIEVLADTVEDALYGMKVGLQDRWLVLQHDQIENDGVFEPCAYKTSCPCDSCGPVDGWGDTGYLFNYIICYSML
jgi:hypothetical protein